MNAFTVFSLLFAVSIGLSAMGGATNQIANSTSKAKVVPPPVHLVRRAVPARPGPKVNGSTSANAGSIPPVNSGNIPPATSGSVPPASASSVPPANAASIPPANSVGVPPANSVRIPPANSGRVPFGSPGGSMPGHPVDPSFGRSNPPPIYFGPFRPPRSVWSPGVGASATNVIHPFTNTIPPFTNRVPPFTNMVPTFTNAIPLFTNVAPPRY